MRFTPAIVVLLCAATAHANPRAFPFTYTTDGLPAGEVEIEQYADLVSMRGVTSSAAKETYLQSAFQTEIEIGLTDRLELGLYLTYVPTYGDQYGSQTIPAGAGTGLKQRLKYLLADPDAWPIDVGVYGELTENESEVELEAKLLLGKRFGSVRVAANLVGETELYFSKQRDIVLAPSLAVGYEVTPALHVGIESFLRGEYPQNPKPATRTFGLGPQAYLGPTVLYNFGKLWWCTGLYTRVTDTSHDLQPGEPYGRFWARTVIGYSL
ncbi:MAG TPA: hypothetical protein VGM90_37380 [Kofleriaceae bacterium]|jgi:hypothetical protein